MDDASFWSKLFSSFMFWKAMALLGVVGVVTFVYSFRTGGRDFWDDLSARRRPPEDPAQRGQGRE